MTRGIRTACVFGVAGLLLASAAAVSASCTSGTVIKIRLVGHGWRIVTGGLAGGKSVAVTSIEITVDPTSGRPCLVSVVTGPPSSPYRNGDDLLPTLAG